MDAEDKDWNDRHRPSWMTDDQWNCAQLARDLCRGWHHVLSDFKPISRTGISFLINSGEATFDNDALTRLVILAHDRCIRASISNGGPHRVKVCLFQRKAREGEYHERHPTIEAAIESLRKIHPQTEGPSQ